MDAKLIVMLTLNDVTVPNARDVFRSCRDLPVEFWGFKNVGISAEETRTLLDDMKTAGKVTCLEVVTYDEDSCLENARMAVELGFDYLTGTLFYPSVWEYLRDKPIRYFPFFGDVSGSPVTLRGTVEEIVADARRLVAAKAVHGLDLVAWRYADGDPVALARAVVAGAGTDVILAGSITSEARMRLVAEIGPFAFTMGSALFDARFVPGGDVRANLSKVIELMKTIGADGSPISACAP